jgi:hypothetical protein
VLRISFRADDQMLKDRNHSALIFFALAGSILLFPSPVYANTIAGWLMVTMSPLAVAFQTNGIGFLVIFLIEAVVLKKYLGLSFWMAIWISFLMNLLTTLAGAVAAVFSVITNGTAIPIMFIAVLLWWLRFKNNIPLKSSRVIVSAIIAFPLPLALGNVLVDENVNYRITSLIFMFGALLPFFGLSVLMEGFFAGKILKRTDVWKSIVIGNIITYLILVPLSAYVGPDMFRGREPWMSRAKGPLRAAESPKIDYQEMDNEKLYALYRTLQGSNNTGEDNTQVNMIENYSMDWEVNFISTISTVSTEGLPTGTIDMFTIRAYPRDARPGILMTFGIGEDQTMRVYKPDNDDDPYNINSWDPVL